MEYTEEQKAALIDYLFKAGKQKIDSAGAGAVDRWAQHYVTELEKLDEDKAEELYQYYMKKWGGGV